MKHSKLSAAILGILGIGSSFIVAAATQVTVCTGEYTKQLSADVTDTVSMWGYSMGSPTDPSGCNGPFVSPGPRIVADGTGTVAVTLYNKLPRATSLVIPGTIKGMAPVFFTGPKGLPRVRSFDIEVPAFNGVTPASATYTWTNLKAGSYMYHSGTHPQVQVQMGLYGAMTNDFSANQAYESVSSAYTQEIILFYYEIDRAMHNKIALGEFTQADMKSTIGYDPKHFFIDVAGNNVVSSANDALEVSLQPNINPLVRFYNAGLRTHIPTVFETDFDIIAEDGKYYPHVLNQYSVSLPPLKTKDAFLNVSGLVDLNGTNVVADSFKLTDSAMAVSNPRVVTSNFVTALAANNDVANGNDNGMVLSFVLTPPAGYVAPVASQNYPKAIKDSMDVTEGQSITGIMAAAMANDINAVGATVDVLTFPQHGDLIADGSGDFTYQNGGDEHSQDSIVYSLTNVVGEKSIAGIIINVASVNDAPNAVNDVVTAQVGTKVEIRVLDNDTDPESNPLTIVSADPSSLGVLTALDKVLILDVGQVTGTEIISYTITDSLGATATAEIQIAITQSTVGSGTYTNPGNGVGAGITPNPVGSPPLATEKSYSVTEGSVLNVTSNSLLGVIGNAIGATASTSLLEYPEHGSIQMFTNGTFIYTHNGDDEDEDHFIFEIYNDYGSTSAEATIKIIPKMNPPRVKNDKVKISKDTVVLIDVLRNDKDKDSDLDPNGIVITKQPSHGTVVIVAGKVQYTPDAGYTGKDKFKYRLADLVTGELSKRQAKVKIKVK